MIRNVLIETANREGLSGTGPSRYKILHFGTSSF